MRLVHAVSVMAVLIVAMSVWLSWSPVAAQPAGAAAAEPDAEADDDDRDANAASRRDSDISLITLVRRGGVLMIPIGLCSIVALAFIVERLIRLRRSQVVPAGFLKTMGDFLDSPEKDNGHALEVCRTHPSPIARILEGAFKRTGRWQKPKPIKEINSEYDEIGPQVTRDGRTLYFYSNRPGGEGGYDLWRVQQLASAAGAISYGILASYQMRDPYWSKWNASLRDLLVSKQVATGKEAGSWDPGGTAWGHRGGRIYTTAMAALCLEVYYRFLPLYRQGEDLAAKPIAKPQP